MMNLQASPGSTYDVYDTLVRDAVARHLGVAPEAVVSSCRLREDLGLDAFDLSMIGLRLEREARRDFPFAILELIESVEQLVGLVRAWATARGGCCLVGSDAIS
jgi:acyl carrier protein